jgi:hypothetical protein
MCLCFSAKLRVLGVSASSLALLSPSTRQIRPNVAIFSFIALWQTWRFFEPGTQTKVVYACRFFAAGTS